MHKNCYSVLLTGIGGQGVLRAAKAITAAAFSEYPYVCRTETRGLSQRGGSVCAIVRFGHSPMAAAICDGTVDMLLAMDSLEACRTYNTIEGSDLVIANAEFVPPKHLGVMDVHENDKLADRLCAALHEINALTVPATKLAVDCGDAKQVNSVMLGAASAYLPLDTQQLCAAMLLDCPTIQHEQIRRAFNTGRDIVHSSQTRFAALRNVPAA